MSDFEQWYFLNQFPESTSNEYEIAKDALQAAKQSMQGEAVAWRYKYTNDGDWIIASKLADSATEKWVHDNYPDFMIESLYTHAPESAARIAEQDARIKELEQQLEEARKDAERMRIVLAGHGEHGFAVSQKVSGNYGVLSGNEAVQAIDAAIRQIGGAE